ncbi:hypothetical protein F511_41052 [Dorcoceras hygrometricum]|uniref:Helicase domain-containing family protein n=1 Tax=Dorcoceras hygrometricum TaxID=472368 RepID=A0A2Z7BVY7_9LAMI|nr:hypothetical protein F511_41052 [Dorcoceras hygrometricum]
MSLFDLQDVCIAIGSLATLDLPMVVDLIGIYGLKGPYCMLTTTNWFLQALSVIPRGSWGDVSRRSYHDPMGKSGIVIPEPQWCGPTASCIPEPLRIIVFSFGNLVDRSDLIGDRSHDEVTAAPLGATTACVRATSCIACDIIACWSHDGGLLDARWWRDCGTLAGRWGSADCASVERCCAAGRAEDARWSRITAAAGRASAPIVCRCSTHGGALREEGLREEAAGRYVRRAWRDSARPCAARNMVAEDAAARPPSGESPAMS